MPRITVVNFLISEPAQSKMWHHGVTIRQLDEVLANRHVITRNRPDRVAPYVLIGRDEPESLPRHPDRPDR